MKRYGILSLKIILWIIGSVIFLVVLAFFLIRVPAVQNFARKKAVSYLEGKLGTRVEINKISLDLPKLLVLEDVYFEDQKRDTLIAGDTLKVDISMLKLLSNKLEINEIDLRGITANIQRSADSTFNYDYILKAFMSEQKATPKPADSTSTLKFSLDKINLDRIKATFKDALTASDMDVYLTHFDTRVQEFDLDKMKFNVPKINLSGVTAKVIQRKPVVKSESAVKDSVDAAEPFNMDITLGPVVLNKVRVYYQNDISAIKTDVNLGTVTIEPEKIDMKNQRINFNKLDINNSKILFALGKTEQAKVVEKEISKEVKVQANNWRVFANTINLNDNDIRFDNGNMPLQKRGMDFGHLDIKNLKFAVQEFTYAIDTISGKITQGSFADKSGFDLKRFETNFFYGATHANLNDLLLQTSGTVIKDRIRLNYKSIESLTTDPGDLYIDANIAGSRLAFRDILTFVPTLNTTEPFKSSPNAALNITGRLNGQLKNLSIPNIELSGYKNTRIKASAHIKGLPDVNKAIFDLNISNFSTRSSDISSLVPKGTIPANIRLPETLNLNGTFKGGLTSFSTNLNLNSSFGGAKAIAFYNAGRKGRETYKANIRLYNFNVGRLIKQEKTFGKITLAANVSGTGTNPKTLSASLNGKLISAVYNGYNYRNLNLTGSSRAGTFYAKADMADPNISFNLSASGNLSKKYPEVNLALNVDSVNLQKLNFMKDDVRFRGQIKADLATADPDYLNGDVLLTNAIVARAGQRYRLDTVSLVSTASADSNTLKLRSEVLTANVSGKYKLTQVGQSMQALLNRYFAIGPVAAKPVSYSPQLMVFNARFSKGPVLTQFVPELKELATVNLTGRFDSEAGQLEINGSAPRIIYGTNTINNLMLNINTANNALNYSFNVAQISTPQLQIQNTSITGNAQNNVLTTEILVKDKNKKDHYHIAGALRSLEKDFEFRLRPEGLMLNYDRWAVSPNNSIRFGESGIQATDFSISNTSQRLSVNTTPPGLNNPLKIDFANFRIETLTQIVKKDSTLVGGTINGTATVSNLQASPVFTADMNVGNFNFRGDTVGNIALKVNNQTANTFTANASITGYGNQVDLSGFYYTNNSSFNLKLNIANLNMKSIEGFSMGNLSNASGSIKGQFDITGTADAPKVRGGLDFNQAAFNITMLNSYFRIRDNRIAFNDEGIAFNDFTLIDSAGNTASLKGQIYTTTFTDFRFGLNFETNDFRVLNSTAKDSELYYGQLYLNSNLRIGGTMNAPAVDGSLRINEKTNLSVLLPQNDPAIEDREGIVEFVDLDNPQLDSVFISQIDSLNKSAITGMDVSVNIEVDKNALFNLVIDEGNGDFVRMKGEAQLNGGIDPSGKVSLTGTYQVEEGAYELSFNFLKRRFDLKKGSLITWTGEPTSANLDVTAIYVANTAPLDLVDNQLGDDSQTIRNTYKQKLPFEVDLTMKGELLKPEITFDIVLPERNYNVSTEITSVVNDRLAQLRQEPSELNKQVFALLLLNRFVGENPFASSASGGGGAESLARQSVSKLLSEQLNNLAGNLIAGVELNFDLAATEDYTTGEMKNRTDLNVGLSKRLLNDRLKVNIGSNFELEGPRQAGAKTSNFAGDISVDYQLSKDGRYMLRAYQRNEYQVALQGQVIETGVSFILTMDYNKFREIFAKLPEDEKQRRKQARMAKKQEKKND